MKTKISILLVALVLNSLLLTVPTSALATPPEPLTITADLWLTGENSAAGTFNASGLLTDTGQAWQEFSIIDNTVHGVKTLVGAEGSITIRFQAQITWTSATTSIAEGRFVIISGTGAYEKLHGVGETYAELDLAAYQIRATYTGNAHFD